MVKTTKQLIENSTVKRPHVVLLGAGASRAAFLNGDANGNKIPIMNDLIKTLGLNELISKASKDNLDAIYSNYILAWEFVCSFCCWSEGIWFGLTEDWLGGESGCEEYEVRVRKAVRNT